MENIIETLNIKLRDLNEDLPIGLGSGKMGLCIYLYKLGRMQNDKKYCKLAESILDEIFCEVNEVKAIDVENGLLGIALGIIYLLRNGYLQGDENVIFKDVDNRVFKYSSFNQRDRDVSILMQLLYYIHVRKQSFQSKETIYLFNELSVELVNSLHTQIEFILNDNSVSFNLESKLPLFLFLLSKIYLDNVNRDKVERIVQEIIPLILSKFEYTNSKRLYLLWGISKINRYIKDRRLTNYCDVLASHINIDDLVEEFKSKNVFLQKGIIGIYLLINSLENDVKRKIDAEKFYIKCKRKIEDSLVWELCDNREYFNNHAGLTGYHGVALVWNMLHNRNEK